MTVDLILIGVFALIAGFVLFKLYDVLGRRVGRQPDEVKAPDHPFDAPDAGARKDTGPQEFGAVAQIKARDPGFEVAKFLDGARQAYETIVKAFSAGDRAALKPLLAPAVDQSFVAAIDTREAEGRSQSTEFLHEPRADLDHLELQGDVARARVRFLAELRTRSKGPEGEAVDDRRTAEVWTFERRVGAADPNWLLARVEAAEA